MSRLVNPALTASTGGLQKIRLVRASKDALETSLGIGFILITF
jgi:hypothetical protein